MGWWGYRVMEGDGPMDVALTVEDILLGHGAGCGDPDDEDQNTDDDGYAADKAKVTELLKDEANIAKVLEQFDPSDATDMQAFGHIVMVAGGPIDSFKQQLIDAIDSDESDAWTDPERRRAEMVKFRQQVLSYDGTPIEDDTQGLFATIFQAIDDGNDNLINKR